MTKKQNHPFSRLQTVVLSVLICNIVENLFLNGHKNDAKG